MIWLAFVLQSEEVIKIQRECKVVKICRKNIFWPERLIMEETESYLFNTRNEYMSPFKFTFHPCSCICSAQVITYIPAKNLNCASIIDRISSNKDKSTNYRLCVNIMNLLLKWSVRQECEGSKLYNYYTWKGLIHGHILSQTVLPYFTICFI